MSEYVPTTDEVREGYVVGLYKAGRRSGPAYEGFNRWLAAHDREVKAAVLREMAEDWMPSDPVSHRFRNWLRDTADLIESEARP